jgi:ESF2/ABP1 family protein
MSSSDEELKTSIRKQNFNQQNEDSDSDSEVDEQNEQENSQENDDSGISDGEDHNHQLDMTEENLFLPEVKPLDAKSLAEFEARVAKTGVCYMSKIPPFMKPEKLRSMLSRYAEIKRIFLNPEDPKIAARRKKYRKNKRKNYVEGWIEFADKKLARQVAEKLNNTNMGGKKRNYYYDDIWNIKYLPKFKWSNLTEQLAYEKKVKEQKLKAEVAQAKRENKQYLKNVAKAKMIEAMEDKKKRKGEDVPSIQRRRFKQRKVMDSSSKVTSKTI